MTFIANIAFQLKKTLFLELFGRQSILVDHGVLDLKGARGFALVEGHAGDGH